MNQKCKHVIGLILCHLPPNSVFVILYLNYLSVCLKCVCVCMCVCTHVCVCIFGQHFFVNTYLIKQYRHPLSTHICIYPFESLHRFYDIRRESVNKPPMINWFPSTKMCRQRISIQFSQTYIHIYIYIYIYIFSRVPPS